MSAAFPFSAVTGQSQMKLALMLCVINRQIGGVLLSGGRGSAKSTLVRGLPALLTAQLVNMPLGASEEMVTGSIKLERALKSGDIDFNPGILARAHEGLLYVDEVNLLPDHLVDLLLDVAASKVNVVERDGISHQHPADFVLIGTMNPDEGELRPQLLDRFGLMATVQSQFDIADRQRIVEQRMAFDADPVAFTEAHAAANTALADQLEKAVRLLPRVEMRDAMKSGIAALCEAAEVEGMRADITMHHAAKAHAALAGREQVVSADIDAVSELVLAHRRQNPQTTSDAAGNGSTPQSEPQNSPQSGSAGGSSIQGSWGAMAPQAVASDAPYSIAAEDLSPSPPIARQGQLKTRSGRKGNHRGRFALAGKSATGKPDWFRTLVAAENRHSQDTDNRLLQLHRRKPQARAVELDVILLDTSASTLGGGGLSHAKGIIRALSTEAYLSRRQLAVVTFGNDQVQTLLHPRKAPKDIEPLLQSIPGGGGTPLPLALQTTRNFLVRSRHHNLTASLFILTDGRAQQSVSLPADLAEICHATVVDIESTAIKLGLGRELASQLGARYLPAPFATRNCH